MANLKQAEKRARQAKRRRAHNATQRSTLRTAVKKVVYALDAKEVTAAEQAYQAAVPVLDKMATKGQIHKNKAARHKSRLSARIKALKA